MPGQGLSDHCAPDSWIITDQGSLRQSVLGEMGLTSIHIHERLHCKQQARYMLNLLSVHKPKILWVRLGGPHSGSGNKHDNLRANNLMQLVREQIACGRISVLEANSRSLAWTLRHVQDVTRHMRVTRHQWCAIEHSCESARAPCNSTIQIATNCLSLRDHICSCKPGIEHVNAKQLSSEEFHTRQKAILKALLTDIHQGLANVSTHLHSQPESNAVEAPMCGAPAASLPDNTSARKIVTFAEDVNEDVNEALSGSNAAHLYELRNSQLREACELQATRAMQHSDYSFRTCELILQAMPLSRSRSSIFHMIDVDCDADKNSVSSQFPQCTAYLCQFGKHHRMHDGATSCMINFQGHFEPHSNDAFAQGTFVSVIGLGAFKRGNLWVELFNHELGAENEKHVVRKESSKGNLIDGKYHCCKHRMCTFSSERRYADSSWEGDRTVIAYYSDKSLISCVSQTSYPTEQALRRREVLKAGHKPAKRRQDVEQHVDDCGDSLDSILLETSVCLWNSSLLGDSSMDSAPIQFFQTAEHMFAQVCPGLIMHGSEADRPRKQFVHNGICSMQQLMHMTGNSMKSSKVHLVELFGGKARTSYLLIRGHHLEAGCNFDIMAGIDLSKPSEVASMFEYIRKVKPTVVLMGPPCKAFCNISRLNRVIHPQAWRESRDEGEHFAYMCYNVAVLQLQAGRHFVIEQPQGSELYKLSFWNDLALDSCIHKCVFDQCQVGLRAPGPNGLPIRKRTELWATHDLLIAPFRNLICDGKHQHAGVSTLSDTVNGVNSRVCQVWPEEMCRKFATAIADLSITLAYPAGDANAPRIACNGCRWHKRKEDPSHSRTGDCRYPDVTAVEWKCPGCRSNRTRPHPSHTLGPDCQWAVTRDMPEGASRERKGHAPRDPRVPASRDPTAQARMEEPTGRPSRSEPSSASGIRRRDGTAQADEAGLDPRGSRSVARESRGVGSNEPMEGPAPEHPPEAREAPEDMGPDWTRFDLGHALQELRSVRESIVRRALRKLHIRFYHPSTQRLRALLAAAGVDGKVLEMVGQITDTCSICRAWTKPGPRSIASTRLPSSFNQEVQVDLLFVKDKIILHVIDVCTRFCAAGVVTSKDGDELLTALHRIWISIFGPPAVIVSDQEGGMVSEVSGAWMARRDIRLVQKARYQHATMVERHHALLRRQLLIMLDQTLDEGLRVSFEAVLCESVYAKNALLRIGGSTPYEAVLGRTPPLFDTLDVEAGVDIEARNSEQVRNKAIAAMLQATAAEKAARAAGSKSRVSGQLLELQVGDLVDFYRHPPTKDMSGWIGPATVVDLTQLKEGQVHVRFQGRVLACRIQDARRAMIFLSFLYAEPSNTPVGVIKHAAESHPRTVIRLGWHKQFGTWKPFENNSHYPKEVIAGLHMAACSMQFNGVISFRFGCEVSSLPGVACDESLLVWWLPGQTDGWCHAFVLGTSPISFEKLTGRAGQPYAFVQFLSEDTEKVLELRQYAHDIPNIGGIHDPTLPPLRDMTDELHRRQVTRALQDAPTSETGLQTFDIFTPPSTSENTSDRAVSEETSSTGAEQEVADNAFACFETHPPRVQTDSLPEQAFVLDPNEIDDGLLEFGVTGPFLRYLTMVPHANDVKFNDTVFFDMRRPVLAVIERVNNILTRAEALQNVDRCREAMVLELMRWHKHGAWERGSRAKARNALTSKWVLKWKDIKGTREIKARLVAQGFKDTQKVENFAGTTSRWGQRLILITSVQFKWRLVSADVSEAFLRGMTFKELYEEGEDAELREVQLLLPPGSVELVRTLPGMEGFSEEEEVLFLRKPGFGLKDAPRLWAKALKRVLSRIGLIPLQTDEQLFAKHNGSSRLVLLVSVHVDDLKITGEAQEIDSAIAVLEKEFDALKLEEDSFTHLGLKHSKEADGSRSVSQQHYVTELKPIPEGEIKAMTAETVVSAEIQKLFMSLLGGVAWVTQTRPDISVFVSALQRRLKQPRACDVINLNRVLKYLKLKPLVMRYAPLTKPWRLVAISDSSFKGEDQDHLAVRAGVIALVDRDGLQVGQNKLQILEFISKKQGKVCRSTFAAELHSCLDLAGMALTINAAMTEILQGTTSAATLLLKQESMNNALELDIIIDARAVFSSVSSDDVKCTDAAVMLHLLRLREMVKTTINRLVWVDTRYMLADGLTKGTVDRTALRVMCESSRWDILQPLMVHARKGPNSVTTT